MALVVLLGFPSVAMAQVVGLDARTGFVWHGGGCVSDTRVTNLSGGLELRTRGRWIVLSGADLFLTGRCLIGVDGDTDSHIRFRGVIGVGHGAMIFGARSELVVGIGTIRTVVADDITEEQVHWYPWQGITLSIRPSGFPLNGQFEFGRHRLPDRNVPAAAPVIWQRFMRLGISFPILG